MENKVGERIRYHRLQRGMSQEKLALMAGINPAFLGHLERGLKSPTMTTVDKIVDALGVSYSEFFDDSVNLEDTESKQFYLDMIMNCAKRLPDDKLKTIADIMLKLIDLTE
ncbi:MAG: helix-turn-helix domain-containing protein [Oscillospiraceae bacterium]|nr:helix-turn-helix domain-containing protein [Oscillospiraceae bacterium]